MIKVVDFGLNNTGQNTISARRTWIKCLYNNKDISADIAKYLKSFSFTDNMSGTVDDVSLSLRDPANLWKTDWLPDRGATLNLSILPQWHGAQEAPIELPLGLFEIDELSYSGAPEVLEIKAVSVPDNTEIRGVEKSRAWDGVYLSVVAKDIANDAGMELFFSGLDYYQKRVEQTQQSDLEFLLKLCNDHGLALKISNNQLVIFNENDYENKPTVGNLIKTAGAISHYSIKAKTRDIYAACHVKYKSASNKNNAVEYTFSLPNKLGKTLEVNEQVETIAEAEVLAKKKLREKNKDEQTVSMTVLGDAVYCAGNCFNLAGFGKFDDKYILTKATHHVDNGGYSCDLDMHKCLVGY